MAVRKGAKGEADRSLTDLLAEAVGDRTQAEVAAEIGVSPARLSRWLDPTNNEIPGPRQYARLARFLHVSEGEIAQLAYQKKTGPPRRRVDDSVIEELTRRVEALEEQLAQAQAKGRKPAARR